MENRIKVQKALAIANQLPSYDKQAAFIEGGGQVVQETLCASKCIELSYSTDLTFDPFYTCHACDLTNLI